MALQGFNETYYLGVKLASLQATKPIWIGKTIADLKTALADAGFTPEQHYTAYGYNEGLAPNAEFNAAEYIQARAVSLYNNDVTGLYASVAAAKAAFLASYTGNVYLDFLQYGEAHNINPSNAFDVSSYYASKLAALQAAPATSAAWTGKTVVDLQTFFHANGFTAVSHYEQYGKAEGIVVTAVPPGEAVTVPSVPGVSYAITPSAASINEGGSEIFTLSTTGVAAGTVLGYTLVGTHNAAGQSASGSFTVDASGHASITIPVPVNATSGDAGTLTLALLNGQATSTVTVADINVDPQIALNAASAAAQAAYNTANAAASTAVANADTAAAAITAAGAAHIAADAKAALTDAVALTATSTAAANAAAAAVTAHNAALAAQVLSEAAFLAAINSGVIADINNTNALNLIAAHNVQTTAATVTTTAAAAATALAAATAATADDAAAVSANTALNNAITAGLTAADAADAATATDGAAAAAFHTAAVATTATGDDVPAATAVIAAGALATAAAADKTAITAAKAAIDAAALEATHEASAAAALVAYNTAAASYTAAHAQEVTNAAAADTAAAAVTSLVTANASVTAANLAASSAASEQAAATAEVAAAAALKAAADATTVTTDDAAATNAVAAAALHNAAAAADVIAAAAKVAAANLVPPTYAPHTFILTTGVDQGPDFTGGIGNDTFTATISGTFQALDSLDGGGGVNTLTVADNGAAVTTAGISVKNIQIANLASSQNVTADTTGWTGLTTLNVNSAGDSVGPTSVTAATTTTAITVAGNTDTKSAGTATVDIIGGGGVLSVTAATKAGDNVTIGGTPVANAFTSIDVTGGHKIFIDDRSGAAAATGSSLTSVSITDAANDQTITANGLTTLSLNHLVGASGKGDTTVIAAAGTRALTVTYNGVDEGAAGPDAGTLTLTDANATTINLKAATAASNDITVVGTAATAYTIDAAVALNIDMLNTATTVATKVGISGAGAVTITADSLNPAAVITSTNTGGVTLTQSLGVNQQFVGTASSGNDTITVAAGGATAISTGAGDDTVNYNGALAAGGSIDAGVGGTDTLHTAATLLATATASPTFATTISNFEVLSIDATTAAATINMANADGINYLKSAGTGAGFNLIVNNAAADFTFEQTGAIATAGESITIALANTLGASDNVNLKYTAADGFTSNGGTVIPGVENLHITTRDTAPAVAATQVFKVSIDAGSVQHVIVDGNIGVDLLAWGTGLNATTLVSLDASGLTLAGANGGLKWTSGALAASSVIHGSAVGDNTVDFSAANTAGTFVTYTGGTGADAVTASNGLNNVVDLGNGANTFTNVGGGGGGNNTITGGTGTDDITVGTGGNTIHLGGGTTANTVTVGASIAVNHIDTTSTGVDKLVISSAPVASGWAPSLTGWTAGDQIDFAAAVKAGPLGAKITLGSGNVFADYLNAAASSNAPGPVRWFEYGTNTYVVADHSGITTFVNGTDVVVELVGIHDLSASTVAGNILTLA